MYFGKSFSPPKKVLAPGLTTRLKSRIRVEKYYICLIAVVVTTLGRLLWTVVLWVVWSWGMNNFQVTITCPICRPYVTRPRDSIDDVLFLSQQTSFNILSTCESNLVMFYEPLSLSPCVWSQATSTPVIIDRACRPIIECTTSTHAAAAVAGETGKAI